MDERELKTVVEFGTPKLSPLVARVRVSFQRRWQARASELVEEVLESSGLQTRELEDRLIENEELSDLLARATERAAGVASGEYRKDIAWLVAAAFRDEAAIEPAAYLTDVVLALEPADLRVLKALANAPSTQAMKGLEPHTYPNGVQILTAEVAEGASVPLSLAGASLQRLCSAGLAYEDRKRDRSFAQARAQRDTRLWSATPLGTDALRHLSDATSNDHG